MQGFHGLIPDRGLAGGFEKREQHWEEGELPVVGMDGNGEVFVYIKVSPRISWILLYVWWEFDVFLFTV